MTPATAHCRPARRSCLSLPRLCDNRQRPLASTTPAQDAPRVNLVMDNAQSGFGNILIGVYVPAQS